MTKQKELKFIEWVPLFNLLIAILIAVLFFYGMCPIQFVVGIFSAMIIFTIYSLFRGRYLTKKIIEEETMVSDIDCITLNY